MSSSLLKDFIIRYIVILEYRYVQMVFWILETKRFFVFFGHLFIIFLDLLYLFFFFLFFLFLPDGKGVIAILNLNLINPWITRWITIVLHFLSFWRHLSASSLNVSSFLLEHLAAIHGNTKAPLWRLHLLLSNFSFLYK